MAKRYFRGFIEFVREQGVVGFAIGFILGDSVKGVVSSLVSDIINPILSLLLGATGNLETHVWRIGQSTVRWGSFLSTVIDFIVIAAVVYFGFKKLGLEKLDKKKE